MPVQADTRVPVRVAKDSDIVAARQAGRTLAMTLGFTGSDLTIIATAISEVARNIVVYAGHGEVIVNAIEEGAKRGILRGRQRHDRHDEEVAPLMTAASRTAALVRRIGLLTGLSR
jgi:uncharacterized heparinase superfamily protein